VTSVTAKNNLCDIFKFEGSFIVITTKARHAKKGGLNPMKKSFKKMSIDRPIGLDNISFDDLDEGDLGSWRTSVTGVKAGSLRSVAKKISAIHSRHSHKHPREH
jgi:hypothetical protein